MQHQEQHLIIRVQKQIFFFIPYIVWLYIVRQQKQQIEA